MRMKKTVGKKNILLAAVSVISVSAGIICSYNMSAASDVPPEFEHTSEDMYYYRDGTGESYTVKKLTYFNCLPERHGYTRLNIISEKSGFIFGDKRDYHKAEFVFRIGNANEEKYIYSVIYSSGREFLMLKDTDSGQARQLEYTVGKYNTPVLSPEALKELYDIPEFKTMLLYLAKYPEQVNEAYEREGADPEKINLLIETVKETLI